MVVVTLDPVSCWHEGWCQLLPDCSIACSGQIFKDVTLLQATGGHDREDALHELRTGRAARAETLFPPQNCLPQDALGRVVCGFHAFHVHKGPQRLLVLDDISARAGCACLAAGGADTQPMMGALANVNHEVLKKAPRQRAITHLMPQMERVRSLCCAWFGAFASGFRNE